MFFYLCKVLFSDFLQFNGNFVDAQNNSEYRDWAPLRRLERVFRCCSACETMEDYKEGYLMVWTNYMSLFSSTVGLYFKGTCDVMSVTMATHKAHKSVSKFQFL